MDTQRETSAVSIQVPEQTLSSLFLRCVCGNPEIMDFGESPIKFIQKKTSIVMSAIMAKELTAELDTQHANTYFSAFHCIEFFSTLNVSTHTTAYLWIHIGIGLINCMIPHLKIRTSNTWFLGDGNWKVFSFSVLGHPSTLLSLWISRYSSVASSVKR